MIRFAVMPGLVPAIRVFDPGNVKMWMAGTSPAMTVRGCGEVEVLA
jgi:hypothetical protein